MTQKGTDIDLPADAQAAPPRESMPQIVVEDDRRPPDRGQQAARRARRPGSTLRELFATRREKTVFLVGAPSLPYFEVVKVIDAAKAAGIDKVGIVTDGMRARAGVATTGS